MKKLKKYFIAFMLLTCVSFTAVSSVSAYEYRDKATWATVGYGYTTSGGFVGAVQADLWATGYQTATGSVDELYGSRTNQGVKYFQNKYGLSADGIVGSNTWHRFELYTYDRPNNKRVYSNTGSSIYEVRYATYALGGQSFSVNYYLYNTSTESTEASGSVYNY
ncbi:peptidoglycan-binding protein [Gracilibacillus caseinilyticus]|uniref:Peptidoglycan-binding protein n=1 Tax=Gracilibacillus caseinilyticus TaxID=2932256 RepID=A0ABY4EX52_9BACI|nr:peptidoglycan-binding protein [Gracilibacillus caseinilyticus]UOQ48437.1 peptidoglycan-binding protein [Gracilibacillus caseinilyticus]